jgi:hypothetical protein
LQNIDLAMTQDGDTVRIVARRLQGVNWPSLQGVSAVLRVPPQAILDLRTSNGTVTVMGPTRSLHVETMNGPIKVTATSRSPRQRCVF